MTVATPPRNPDTEHDRDLERRVADLEALIEEARRRARRRRIAIGTVLAVVAAGAAGLSGFFGGGGKGSGATPLAGEQGASGQSGGPASSLAGLPHGNRAMAFAFDPHRPNVVYVASPHARGGVYVFKTTDGGRHWRSTGAVGTGWRSDVLSLRADPRSSGTLYAGTDTAVYKTVDGGRAWRPFKQGLFPSCDSPYCTDVGTPGTPTWNRNNGWVLDVAVDPRHRNVVYSAAGAVRKSTNGGRTWTTVLEPAPNWRSVSRIAIAPTRPESIYAILHNSRNGVTGIFKSTSAGETWQRAGSGLPASCCWDSEDDLAIDPANPQILYAAVGSTVLASTDGGANWQPRANGLPANAVTSLVADPRRPGTLYASVDIPHTFQPGDVEKPTGGIYQTTDGGKTWAKLWSGFGVDKVAIDLTRPSTIYAAGWTGRSPGHGNSYRLLKSTDGGRTWVIAG